MQKKLISSHQSDEIIIPMENREFADLLEAIKEDDDEYIRANITKAIKARGWHGKSLLHKCAAIKNTTKCCTLLAQSLAGIRDRDDMTALMIAARAGNYENVKILAPYEIGMKLWDGRVAVHFAIYSHYINLSIVELLLKNGEANVMWDDQSLIDLIDGLWLTAISEENSIAIKKMLTSINCPNCKSLCYKVELGGTHNRQCSKCNNSVICSNPSYDHDKASHMKVVN